MEVKMEEEEEEMMWKEGKLEEVEVEVEEIQKEGEAKVGRRERRSRDIEGREPIRTPFSSPEKSWQLPEKIKQKCNLSCVSCVGAHCMHLKPTFID